MVKLTHYYIYHADNANTSRQGHGCESHGRRGHMAFIEKSKFFKSV